MPQRANITSVDAIQEFRTHLLVFLSKARPALDEAGGEVLRLRNWLQNEQRNYWDGLLRRRRRKLEEAEAALFGARLSTFQDVSAAQQAAVHKARREVNEAEEKLRTIKRWERDFENRTEPLLKQQEKLNNVLAMDVPNAASYLSEMVDTLLKYAGVVTPAGEGHVPQVLPEASPAAPIDGPERKDGQ